MMNAQVRIGKFGFVIERHLASKYRALARH